MRDYEYKRLGKVSLLAGIDLQIGETTPLANDTHTSILKKSMKFRQSITGHGTLAILLQLMRSQSRHFKMYS